MELNELESGVFVFCDKLTNGSNGVKPESYQDLNKYLTMTKSIATDKSINKVNCVEYDSYKVISVYVVATLTHAIFNNAEITTGALEKYVANGISVAYANHNIPKYMQIQLPEKHLIKIINYFLPLVREGVSKYAGRKFNNKTKKHYVSSFMGFVSSCTLKEAILSECLTMFNKLKDKTAILTISEIQSLLFEEELSIADAKKIQSSCHSIEAVKNAIFEVLESEQTRATDLNRVEIDVFFYGASIEDNKVKFKNFDFVKNINTKTLINHKNYILKSIFTTSRADNKVKIELAYFISMLYDSMCEEIEEIRANHGNDYVKLTESIEKHGKILFNSNKFSHLTTEETAIEFLIGQNNNVEIAPNLKSAEKDSIDCVVLNKYTDVTSAEIITDGARLIEKSSITSHYVSSLICDVIKSIEATRNKSGAKVNLEYTLKSIIRGGSITYSNFKSSEYIKELIFSILGYSNRTIVNGVLSAIDSHSYTFATMIKYKHGSIEQDKILDICSSPKTINTMNIYNTCKNTLGGEMLLDSNRPRTLPSKVAVNLHGSRFNISGYNKLIAGGAHAQEIIVGADSKYIRRPESIGVENILHEVISKSNFKNTNIEEFIESNSFRDYDSPWGVETLLVLLTELYYKDMTLINTALDDTAILSSLFENGPILIKGRESNRPISDSEALSYWMKMELSKANKTYSVSYNSASIPMIKAPRRINYE